MSDGFEFPSVENRLSLHWSSLADSFATTGDGSGANVPIDSSEMVLDWGMNSLGGRVGWKEDTEVIVQNVPFEELDLVSEDDVAEEEEKELDLEAEGL